MQRVSFHKYCLEPNSEGVKPRFGALLKVKFSGYLDGYSCLHPLTDWGDDNLDVQLNYLKADNPTTLAKRALELARKDSFARSQNISLAPKNNSNHWLLLSGESLKDTECQSILERGFSVLKIKGIRPILELNRYAEYFKLRLDFNEQQSLCELKNVLENLSYIKSRIDFVEDPIAFDLDTWAKMSASLEIDFAKDCLSEGLYKTQVVKPARVNPALYKTCNRVIMTSCLDHPLGQRAAASEIKNGSQEINGLCSHLLFKTTEFSERLGSGPALQWDGVGFGFDDLLKNAPWVDL